MHSRLEGLLIGLWLKCHDERLAVRSAPLIDINGPDEIDDSAARNSCALFHPGYKHCLRDRESFAINRPDPHLIDHIDRLDTNEQYRLEEVLSTKSCGTSLHIRLS